MTNGRIEILDFARGVALVAMTIFHFAFDLELLGYQEPGFISQPHWKYFARVIASSFLILVGISLVIAHGDGVRWKGWRLRMAKIVGAAILITAATWFATPDQYIFFGILHLIAFASLAGLMFLKLPWLANAGIAVGIFLIGQYGRTELIDNPVWFWTGLTEARPSSSDYVPVFPWMSAPLLGIAFAQLALAKGWIARLAQPEFSSALGRGLKFIGRNSLIYYLLHQPVMLGLLLAVSLLTGHIHL